MKDAFKTLFGPKGRLQTTDPHSVLYRVMNRATPRILARLNKEVCALATKPPQGVRFVPMEDMESLVEIHAELDGPGMCKRVNI